MAFTQGAIWDHKLQAQYLGVLKSLGGGVATYGEKNSNPSEKRGSGVGRLHSVVEREL